MPSPTPAEQRWREQLSRLRVWKRGDERAVHKPLLTLMLLKQAADGGDGVLRFALKKGGRSPSKNTLLRGWGIFV